MSDYIYIYIYIYYMNCNFIQLVSAMRLMSDWFMDRQQQMVGWRCVLMGCGAQSVMTDGTPEMLKLSADSWDLMDVSNTSSTIIITFTLSC